MSCGIRQAPWTNGSWHLPPSMISTYRPPYQRANGPMCQVRRGTSWHSSWHFLPFSCILSPHPAPVTGQRANRPRGQHVSRPPRPPISRGVGESSFHCVADGTPFLQRIAQIGKESRHPLQPVAGCELIPLHAGANVSGRSMPLGQEREFEKKRTSRCRQPARAGVRSVETSRARRRLVSRRLIHEPSHAIPFSGEPEATAT